MTNNMQRLGDTLSGRMKKTAGAFVPTTVELGVINSNMSLSTDSMKTPIPKGQYMVDLRLTGETNTSTNGDHGGHGESGATAGAHSHTLPSAYRKLKAGDRVMVIWCGNEPVVMAIVTSS